MVGNEEGNGRGKERTSVKCNGKTTDQVNERKTESDNKSSWRMAL